MKNLLRKNILTHRKTLSDLELSGINQSFLSQFIEFFKHYQKIYNPKIIGGYVSINNEINVLPALDYCRELGLKTALPYCQGKNTPLTFHYFNGDIYSLSFDSFKILAPNPKSPVVIPDLILCPAVGVCRKTHKRLGYGGGFYDKYAAKNPNIHYVAGFCDYQLIDKSEIFEPHDAVFFHIIKIII
jgi:5-formyltetrahydrofolate cyclo-ligase